jgi:hypothetical protein
MQILKSTSIWRLHSVNFITLKSLSSDHFQFSSVFSSSYLSLCDYHVLHCFVFSLKLFLHWLYRPLITINQINKWHNIFMHILNGFWQSKIFLLKDILLKKELPITTTTCLSLVKEGPQSYCLLPLTRSISGIIYHRK